MKVRDGRDERLAADWRTGVWHNSGKPPALPLELRLADFALSLERLRSLLGAADGFGEPLQGNDPAEHKLGFYNPPLGKLLGMAMAPRIGALLSRPGCVFNNSFVWQFDCGSDMPPHIDRPPLDITMSVPVILDGADAWPVRVRQPDGKVIEWPSRPGSVLLFDGRWRPHWREAFEGRHSLVLLLHWRAPAILWSDILDAEQRKRLRTDTHGERDYAELIEPVAAAVRSAVPQAATPQLELVDLEAQTFPDADGGGIFLAPIEDAVTLAFDRAEVTFAPGDGVSFAARDECRLSWCSGNGVGKMLVGRATVRMGNAGPACMHD